MTLVGSGSNPRNDAAPREDRAFDPAQGISSLAISSRHPISSGPASRRLVPACGGLGHTCSADAGNADNLLDREMRPPEPQQTGIAFRA